MGQFGLHIKPKSAQILDGLLCPNLTFHENVPSSPSWANFATPSWMQDPIPSLFVGMQ